MDMVKKLLCRKTVCLLLFAVAVSAIYASVLDFPFVLDDMRVVERNIKLRNLSNFFDFSEIFRLRPFVNMSFALDHRIAGLNLKMFHLTNIFIHILNTILVFFFVRLVFRLTKPETEDHEGSRDFPAQCLAPFFAAALFALHPLQSQAVIYISQRAALLAAFFYMASVMCYLSARIRQTRHTETMSPVIFFFGFCFLFAVCAFLSKKNSASLPLALLAAEILFFDNSWDKWKKKLPVLIGLCLVIFMAFAWLAGAFRGDLADFMSRIDRLTRETYHVTRWEYLCTQFNVIWRYIQLILFPKGLNIDHAYPFKTGFFDDATPFAFTGLLALAVLALFLSKKHKAAAFGIFWFFIALSIESGIIPIRDAMFEHRVYLPFAGVSLIAAFAVDRLARKKELVTVAVCCLLLVACAVTTKARTHVWESELSLWRDSVSKAPHNPRAWNNLGTSLVRAGRRDAAARKFQKAIELDPQFSKPYCNLGKYYAGNGDLEKAEKLFLRSIELNSRFAEACNNLAIVYATKGELKKGLKYFKKSLKIDNSRAYTHFNTGKLYMSLDKVDKALSHFLRAQYIDPDIKPRVFYETGAAYALKKNRDKAVHYVLKAQKRGFDAVAAVKQDPRFKPVKNDMLNALSRFKQ